MYLSAAPSHATDPDKPIDKPSITSDADGRENVSQLIISKHKQERSGDTAIALAVKFADMLLTSAEEMVPRQIRKPRTQCAGTAQKIKIAAIVKIVTTEISAGVVRRCCDPKSERTPKRP